MSSSCGLSLILTILMITIKYINSTSIPKNTTSNGSMNLLNDEKKQLNQSVLTLSDDTVNSLYDEQSDSICGMNYDLQSNTNEDNETTVLSQSTGYEKPEECKPGSVETC